MKYTYENINYDKLWSPSGDPFVDAGGFALNYLSEKFPEKNILELIDFAIDIYVNKWNSAIQRVFFNSKITNNSVKGKQKITQTHNYFEGLIKEKTNSHEGFCRILGFKTKLFQADRTNFPISGAQSLTNFFHSFESGLMLSKEAIIRVFFLPLGCEIIDGRLAIINSNVISITKNHATSCCERNLANIGQNASSNMLESKFHSPGTALFKFVDSILDNCWHDKVGVNLFLFNNGKDLDFEHHAIPETVFLFYKETQKSYCKGEWDDFVSHFYVLYSDCNYSGDKVIVKVNKKLELSIDIDNNSYWNEKIDNQNIDNETKMSYRNIIYDRLLLGLSITKILLKWSEKNHFCLALINSYLYNIKKMKIETINKINEIADFILSNTPETEMKKVITNLNGVKSASLLRRFILKVVEKNYKLGKESAIVTVKEYTEYLFPETGSWMEIRDVLLIDIYQKLHERKVKVDTEQIDFELIDDED